MSCKIQNMLDIFPVICVLGSRQVGKTTITRQMFPDWQYIDLEKPADLEYVSSDPSFFFYRNPRSIIIDEAQAYPELFNALRGAIDDQRKEKGRYILTGSSSPDLLSSITESLAGRVGIVKLSPLKANEFYDFPLSDFYKVFDKKLCVDNFVSGKAPIPLKYMQNMWLCGGYPEPRLMENGLHYQQWMEQYVDSYVYRDIGKLFPRLNKESFQRFLRILSKLSGTVINQRELARSIEVSAPTIKDYLQIIEGTFIWRSLNSYEKNIVKAVIKMPKGLLRDSGLLHHLLNIPDIESLYHDPISGLSFESFAIEEIIRGLESTMLTNWHANYYRTRNGAEIDLILSGSFGVLPIEIKKGSYTKLNQLSSLRAFVKELNLPYGVVVNQSESVKWLSADIVQLPIGFL